MLILARAVLNLLFPRRGTVRQISYRYVALFILLPLAAGGAMWWLSEHAIIQIHSASVIAESFGVLGGLLFAHAIFVFQLRVSYDSAKVEPPAPDAAQEDLRVKPLIDEMFNGVLYSSLIALVLTLVTAAVAAVLPQDTLVPQGLSVLIVVVGTHLVGCIVHVMNVTVTAYSVLRAQPR